MAEHEVIVIPTYQERESIAVCIKRVRRHAPNGTILVVDDGSPDGTAEVVIGIGASDPGVRLIPRKHKEGLGPAYIAGFLAALELNPTVIVQMDADLSHDPAQLRRLTAPIATGAVDLAIGSRRITAGKTEGWGRFRNLLSRFGSRYAQLLLGLSASDSTSGFRAWNPRLLRDILRYPVHASGYAFQVEMAWRAERAGGVVREFPITFRDRKVGRSKMTVGIAIEAASIVLRLALDRRIRR